MYANFVPFKPVFMVFDLLISRVDLNKKSFRGMKMYFVLFLLVLKYNKKVE
jgi:hypothetical protein